MYTLLLAFIINGDGLFFQGSVEEAIAQARLEGKQVIVDVYTDWCGPCRLMDRTTFKNSNVQNALKEKAITVKVNAEEGTGSEFARKHKVRAYPSFLVFNPDGTVAERRMGFMNAHNFLSWINTWSTQDGGEKATETPTQKAP